MENSLQTDQLIHSISSPTLKTPQAELPQKKASRVTFAIGILITASIAGAAGYFVGTSKTNQVPVTTLSQSAQPTPQPQVVPTPSPETSDSKRSIVTSSRPGWVKYTNESLGLSFDYPTAQLELREEEQPNLRGAAGISLYSNQTKDLEGHPVNLLSFSTTYSPETYSDPNVPESIDKEYYTIQGQKYDALKFIMGEGGPCGGGGVNTTVVKLKEKLIAYKYELYSSRNKDQQNCEGNAYDEFKTPKKDLSLADTVIETIELVR